MDKKTLILAVFLALFIRQTAFGQAEGRFVTVGDTTINLADVDLEKGLVVEKKEFSIDTGASGPTRYRVKIRVFSGTASENFAIVYDTTRFLNRSKYNYNRRTSIQYFNGNNEMLFEKHFKHLMVSRLYVSFSGEAVLITLISEDLEQVHLYNKNGDLIKIYDDGYERLYVGSKHNYFFMCNHNEYQGQNTYDRIDKSGNIEEIIFPPGRLLDIHFSAEENYYLVAINKKRLLYNSNNNLIWQVEDPAGPIYFLFDEKKYLTHNRSSGSIEVKDLFSHEIIYTIDSVVFNNEKMPIYRGYLMDNNFYTIGRNKYFYIYNFYNQDGELLQTETTDINFNYRKNKITKKEGIFIISTGISSDKNK